MKPIKAVIDTNVLVSAFLKANGRESLIFRLAKAGRFVPVISGALLDEYLQVLGRRGFGFDPRLIRQELQAFQRHAAFAEPQQSADAAYDPGDNMVLDCAIAGGADYLVTGNVRHFPEEFQEVQIIRPRQFVVVLAAALR